MDLRLSVYRLDLMSQDDVPEVSRVERRCFSNPWPSSAYRRELQNPRQNWYVVLRTVAPDSSRESFQPEPGEPIDDAPKSLPRRSLFPINLTRKQEPNGDHSAIVGFAGMWMAFDEAHITTIGIDAGFRGRGLGELLLLSLVDEAVSRGANWLTLEVRVSNVSAQTLYRKYGFSVHGTRKRYYSDNNEDALIMWSPSLREPSFRERIEKLRNALDRRLGTHVLPGTVDPFAASLARVSGQ